MGYNKGYIFKSSEEESEMSDAKEYWPYTDETTQGNIKISEDVIASIATIAVTETEGVASTAASMGVEITEMFAGRKNGAPRKSPAAWWSAALSSNSALRSPKWPRLCRKM